MSDNTILRALRGYRCQYTQDADCRGGLPLVDVLTPPGEDSIDLGEQEMELLADAIWCAVQGEIATARREAAEAMREACVDLAVKGAEICEGAEAGWRKAGTNPLGQRDSGLRADVHRRLAKYLALVQTPDTVTP